MPNQLSESKKRMTYSEFQDVYEELKTLALDSRQDVSHLIRQATNDYLKKKQHGLWKAAPYKTQAEIRTSKMRRVSYTEWIDTHAELMKICDAERLDLSDILREAAHTFLANRK